MCIRDSVPTEREFHVKLRVAALSAEGSLAFYSVIDSVESELFAITTPVTGGWQDWVTIHTKALMPAGSYTLRLKILGAGEFNLNWFEFSNVITGFSTNNRESLFYPNPTKEFINIKDPDFDNFSILTLNGSKVMSGVIPENGLLSFKTISPGIYVIRMISQKTRKSINQKLIITDNSL